MSDWTGKGSKTRVSNYRGYWNNFDNIKPLKPKTTTNMHYTFRSDKIILIGDTHDTSVTYELLNTRIPNGSDVVHIGDGGWGFGNPAYAIENALSWLDRINTLCVKLDIRLYHLRGNHDNPDSRIWDSKWPNIFLIHTGDTVEFPNEKSVLFVCGGVSVDRYVRKEGESYWKGETTQPLDNVPKCDIMFSHDCPEYFNHPTISLPEHYGWYVEKDITLMDDCLKQRNIMGDIVKQSEVKTIMYGHFHNDLKQEQNGVYARCLDISELFEFDANRIYHE